MNVKRTLKILEEEYNKCKTDEDFSVIIFKLDNILRTHKYILDKHKDKETVNKLKELLTRCIEDNKKLHIEFPKDFE